MLKMDSFKEQYNETHPEVTQALSNFFSGQQTRIHFYGPLNEIRFLTFALLVREITVMKGKVTVYDSSDLTQKYFSKELSKPEIRLHNTPTIFILGKEVEKRLGLFYFRQIVEQVATRKIGFVLFTDHSPDIMESQYGDFKAYHSLLRLNSVALTD